jgi:hypothetical protein
MDAGGANGLRFLASGFQTFDLNISANVSLNIPFKDRRCWIDISSQVNRSYFGHHQVCTEKYFLSPWT